jgi:hypothetical protein
MVGTYHVVYSAPGGYGFAPGTSNEADVTINDGQITDVEFFLEQVVGGGSVRVTVTGLTPAATSGGYALVLRTDIPGQTPVSLPIPAGGQADAALQSGTYDVSYTAPSGFRLVSGQTNPQTITVVGAQVEVTFNVEEVPPSTGAILFAAQWRTTGNTANALRDHGAGGYRWDSAAGGGSVVTAASTGISGWPTANVLRVPSGAGEAWCKLVVNTLPALAVGNTRYIRWYHAATMDANPNDSQCHPCETGDVGLDEEYGIGQWFRDSFGADIVPANWNLSILCDDEVHYREKSGPAFGDPVIRIPQYTVYRIELAIVRISTAQYQVRARRYNAAGVLEADENDFYADGVGVLAGRTFNIVNPATYTTWDMGSNQSGWMPAGAAPQSYQAAVAISDEGWLGPYNAATEAAWDEQGE